MSESIIQTIIITGCLDIPSFFELFDFAYSLFKTVIHSPLIIMSQSFSFLKELITNLMGSFLWIVWPPAKRTINQFIEHTPNFWVYFSIIGIIGFFISIITMIYVETRWYMVIGLGWLVLWSFWIVSGLLVFEGHWPWYAFLIVCALINAYLLHLFANESIPAIIKAFFLFNLSIGMVIAGEALLFSHLLCEPFMKVMTPPSPSPSVYYFSLMEAYKELHVLHDVILHSPMTVYSINGHVVDPDLELVIPEKGAERILQIVDPILKQRFSGAGSTTAYFLWPVVDGTIFGDLVRFKYMEFIHKQYPNLSYADVNLIYTLFELDHINYLYYRYIPYNLFLQSPQSLNMIVYSLPSAPGDYHFVIMAGIPGTESKYFVAVTPETARILEKAVNAGMFHNLTFFDYIDLAGLLYRSMDKDFSFAMSYGAYFGEAFFVKTLFLLLLLIIGIHSIKPIKNKILAYIEKKYQEYRQRNNAN